MSYSLILETLREFDLITNEQLLDAMAAYERETQEYEARKEIYRQQWYERRASWGRWKRFKAWIRMDYWMTDWFDEPREVRYPPEWLR